MTLGIVWLRQDLRLQDNPALLAASQVCDHIIPLFIDDPLPSSVSQLGAASQVWLHHSLQALQNDLSAYGQTLIMRQGEALEVLTQLIQDTQATHLFWNRCYDPATLARDKHLKAHLSQYLSVQSFNSLLLYEPWQILKSDNTPFKVFTAYWKHTLKQGIDQPVQPAPATLPKPTQPLASLTLDQLKLLPTRAWDKPMMQHWQVGELAAHQKLTEFLQSTAKNYAQTRDLPAQSGTSQLSPHLHFGEISPRQAIRAALQWQHTHPEASVGLETFMREIGWREFAYYLLYHFPHTANEPLDQRFKNFTWRTPDHYAADLKRWQQGQTGIPMVDAGMRQLWQSGWMHNRVRMVVASFLTKNLLIPWQEGEQWFRDTLVDADLASNVLGWQWTAGCGADAAPYFRIFNPVTQGEKFDPQGEYVKRWVGELQPRAVKAIHAPRQLGESLNYPLPIVDLAASRVRALAAYDAIKTTKPINAW